MRTFKILARWLQLKLLYRLIEERSYCFLYFGAKGKV